MNYKGKVINDNEDVRVKEFYKELGSNNFGFYKEELKDMLHDFEAKEQELKEKGLDPEHLYLDFYAKEECDGDYYQCDAGCEVNFVYRRPETEDEKETRILRAMERIDQEIKEKQDKEAWEKARETSQIADAMAVLKRNGYKIEGYNIKK